MKKEISNQDLELICAAIAPGAYTIEFQSKAENIQMNSGESLADYNKPSSLILVNYKSDFEKFLKFDFIIDFTGRKVKREGFYVEEFIIKMNPDGSIRYLYEAKKRDRFLGLKFFSRNERKVKIYYKSTLFFKKQFHHLPSDNFWINFGNSTENRQIEIALYNKNHHIFNMHIAFDSKSLTAISKEKYYMSKLSFCNFETIEVPNEYFSKSPKVLITSIVQSSNNSNKIQEKFVEFISETISKTSSIIPIGESTYYREIWKNIHQTECNMTKEKLLELANNIDPTENLHFGFSFGSLNDTMGKKIISKDFLHSNNCAPILSDFFFQILGELHKLDVTSNFELVDFVKRKIKEFQLGEVIKSNNISYMKHFYLFYLHFVSQNFNVKQLKTLGLCNSFPKQYDFAS